jgi:LruC domain-containing protein
MFEDLWPAEGDYDLNDLVIKMRMITYFDAENKWTGGSFDFFIWTNGADLKLGCGIEFVDYLSDVGNKMEFKYLNPDQLTLDPGTYDPAHTMLDPDVSNSVIIFSDVSAVKSSNYWNTGFAGSANPMADSISFSYSVAPPTYWMAGFLYLFRSDDRSHEVRPIGFPPTTAAEWSFFGTHQDDSPTATWDWTPGTVFLYPLDPPFYADVNRHPWGIELEYAGDLPVPFERVSIVDAFPDFVAWAESGGTSYTTWYENPVADPTKVFNVGALVTP